MTLKSLDELLEAMLDAVIDVTGAEKGLILLLDEAYGSDGSPSGQGGKPVIRASRHVKREAITDTTGRDLRQHRAPGARDRAARSSCRDALADDVVRHERERRRAPALDRHVRAARLAGAGHRRALRRQRLA